MQDATRTAFRVFGVLGAAAVTAAMLGGGASGQARRGAGETIGIGPAQDATFRTVFPSPAGIEGLTGDRQGNLFTAGRSSGGACPVWRVPAAGGSAQVVGRLPAPCGPEGLAFDASGRLYVGDGDRVDVLRPDAQSPPTATVFATGVPGANGLAFDPRGNLWVSDGITGQGRVWRVGPSGGAAVEAFRTQALANDVNVVDGKGGVGRDDRALPPGSVTIADRQAADTPGSQPIVANGLAFTPDARTLYVADTARGAIWRVALDGTKVVSPAGCDTTFPADTLCLDDVFVEHPYLEGADGIALDGAGNIWTAANERNAIVVVGADRRVREFFRDAPDATTRLRNGGPLEFPTSPFLAGRRLCLTNSDGGRRDNVPADGGEAAPGTAVQGKIGCMDQSLPFSGLPLPVGRR